MLRRLVFSQLYRHHIALSPSIFADGNIISDHDMIMMHDNDSALDYTFSFKCHAMCNRMLHSLLFWSTVVVVMMSQPMGAAYQTRYSRINDFNNVHNTHLCKILAHFLIVSWYLCCSFLMGNIPFTQACSNFLPQFLKLTLNAANNCTLIG